MQPIAVLAENVHASADPILRDAGFAIERHAGALEGDALRTALFQGAGGVAQEGLGEQVACARTYHGHALGVACGQEGGGRHPDA